MGITCQMSKMVEFIKTALGIWNTEYGIYEEWEMIRETERNQHQFITNYVSDIQQTNQIKNYVCVIYLSNKFDGRAKSLYV